MNALRPVHQYLLKYKWLFLAGTLFVGLANLFQVYAPHFIGDMIDAVAENADTVINGTDSEKASAVYRFILINALLFIGITLLRGVVMFFMRRTIIVSVLVAKRPHIEFEIAPVGF